MPVSAVSTPRTMRGNGGWAPVLARCHSTARAALIYQHAAEERNVAIAATLDVLAGRALEPRVQTRRAGLEAVIRLGVDA